MAVSNVELSTAEQLTYSTVRIECEKTSGERSVGTGFFFRFSICNDQFIPIIVTNRHVVDGTVRGMYRVNLAERGKLSRGNFRDVIIDNFEQQWVQHPNTSVDLCAMPFAPLLHASREQNIEIFFSQFDESLILKEEKASDLDAIEETLMIGYPAGVRDSANNMPIVRRGITATHPLLDYEGRKEFLIDAACFPGSSGSPIVIYNSGTYRLKGQGLVVGTRLILLGILWGGPQYTVEGEIKAIPIPTQMKPVLLSQIPMNLGFVIKAERILEFKPIFASMALEESQS